MEVEVEVKVEVEVERSSSARHCGSSTTSISGKRDCLILEPKQVMASGTWLVFCMAMTMGASVKSS